MTPTSTWRKSRRERIVEYLERSRFVVMKRAPLGSGAALGRGFES
jgi:hypothetical protein